MRALINTHFTCFICYDTVRDAHLCPHCSKIGCAECLRKWITEQRPQCPHCRAPLRVSKLVKCRFVNELSEDVAKISQHEVEVDRRAKQARRRRRTTSHSSRGKEDGLIVGEDGEIEEGELSLPSGVAAASRSRHGSGSAPNSSRSSEEACPEHSLPLLYYCKTCTCAVCSDCAMFASEVRGDCVPLPPPLSLHS